MTSEELDVTAAAQKRNAIIWSVIGVVSLLMIVAPLVGDIDMDSGGGALILFGVIGVICSVLVAAMYFKRARTLAGMESGENLLVWELPEENGGRTVISMDGIVTGNLLYTFKDVVCKLTKVQLKAKKLELTIEVPKRDDTRLVLVELPIPEGQLDTARQAAEKLTARYLA